MQRKFLLIGTPAHTAAEAKKLQTLGFVWIKQLNSAKAITTDLLHKVVASKITDVVCIRTRNGETCHWAVRLTNILIDEVPVKVFGVNIPPHHQKIKHKGASLFTPITCSMEINPIKKEAA